MGVEVRTRISRVWFLALTFVAVVVGLALARVLFLELGTF